MSANLDLVRSIYATGNAGTTPALTGPIPKSSWCSSTAHLRAAGGDWLGWRTPCAPCLWISRTSAQRLRYRELDDDCVLVLTRVFGRGKRSVVPFRSTVAEVLEVHDGKVTRIVVYFERDHAMSDLGLTPEKDQ
jgi:hypothetical protein